MAEKRRGRCPECPGTFTLTRDGLLRHHLGTKYEGRWRQVCDGVGRASIEVATDPTAEAEARGERRGYEQAITDLQARADELRQAVDDGQRTLSAASLALYYDGCANFLSARLTEGATP